MKSLIEIYNTFANLIFWHGSPSGNLKGSYYGLHIGSLEAAREALEARIGVRADGKDWDGTQIYGKTLLAGSKKQESPNFRETVDVGYSAYGIPEEDFYATDFKHRAKYSDGTIIPFNVKPIIFKVQIIGRMTNTPNNPMSDDKANSIMARQIKMGKTKSGYFYKNDGEDYGSISAVVPDKTFLKIIGHV